LTHKYLRVNSDENSSESGEQVEESKMIEVPVAMWVSPILASTGQWTSTLPITGFRSLRP
jgi:hypothetical protein